MLFFFWFFKSRFKSKINLLKNIYRLLPFFGCIITIDEAKGNWLASFLHEAKDS